ncbi:ABC transporter permease [Streptomyces buecherae]|uniref:ABC transporter permease n=1 Tax=Streptomyces buecherae TaxID=2763006 RepID=UPI0037B756C7
MREALLGEWTKAWTGRAWAVLTSIAVFMSLLTSFGYAAEGDKSIGAGQTDIAAVTDDVVRSWMTTFLFASLFGALLVTREYSSGSISRAVLLTGRGRLFTAKLVIGAAVGVLSGLLAVVLAAVSSWVTLAGYGRSPEWTSETWLVALGVFACNVLAAPWGVFIGWIVRHQIRAVGALMALTLLLDPSLQRLVPDVAKYLLTIAMSSVYRDVHTDLLSPGTALLVIAGWLGVAGLAAHRLFRSRDIT